MRYVCAMSCHTDRQAGVDNFRLVPDSSLIVTRTAFRNNSSKYSINDHTSTFTEVTTLLKAKGIDLDHNRFLILQVRHPCK